MMGQKYIRCFLAALLPVASIASAQPTTQPSLPTAIRAATAGLVVARANEALARSCIPAGSVNLIKGEIAERIAVKPLLEHMAKSGNWLPISARTGRTGFDGLFIKMDANGLPRSVLASEVKYGTSKLGYTADGVQMGSRWTAKRLLATAERYRALGSALREGKISLSRLTGNDLRIQKMPLPIKGDTEAFFWRENSLKPWKLHCDRNSAQLIERQTQRVTKLLEAAGNGRVSVRSNIVLVKPTPTHLEVTFLNASKVDGVAGDLTALPQTGRIRVPLNGRTIAQIRTITDEEIEKAMVAKYPHLAGREAAEWARNTARNISSIEDIRALPRGYISSVARSMAIGGAITLVVDPLLRYAFGERSSERLLLGTGASVVTVMTSVAVGELTRDAIMNNPALYRVAAQVTARLGLGSTTLVAQMAGATAAMGVVAIGLPLLEYTLGLIDGRTAQRQMIAGGIGVGAGAAASAATMALIAAYGTASTGTAIATLSGASASGATMAWLGGGSLAAGGLGASGGAIVLTGGVAVVVVAVAAGVMVGFQYFDAKDDAERIQLTIEDLSNRKTFPMQRVGSAYNYNQAQHLE